MGDNAESKDLEEQPSKSLPPSDQVVHSMSETAHSRTAAVEVFCRQCGVPREDRDRYCTGCGALLPPARTSAIDRRRELQARAPQPPIATVTYGQNLNPAAVLATVGGIVSLAALPLQVGWLWFFGAVAAVVLGFVARSQINSTGQAGRGYMIAGLTMGFLSFGIVVLILLFGLAALSMLAR